MGGESHRIEDLGEPEAAGVRLACGSRFRVEFLGKNCGEIAKTARLRPGAQIKASCKVSG